MSKLTFTFPVFDDVEFIARHLRAEDHAEIFASCGAVRVLDVLKRAVNDSAPRCWTAMIENVEPMCVFGVARLPTREGVGIPWLLGTDKLFTVGRKALLRDGKQYISLMLRSYPYLVNFVDARNKRSVRWLAHLGFTVHAPEPYGPFGFMFHRFDMGKPNV